MQIYKLHKIKRFLKRKKNDIISEAISRGCKEINARGPWGKG